MFYSGHFDLHKGHSLETPYVLDIGLQAVKAGVKMTLENIFFETDSYELRDESKIELEGLISFMKENPEVKILIGGHTDNQGPAAYNQLLSENRAKSVFIYLTKYKGFGMNQPIDDNSSIEGRAKNRRTEITVL
jgi:outer membrane protein OmpA-like peptidoglycan-associated protein